MPNLRTENAAELAAMLAGRLASGRVDHEKAQRPAALVIALQKAARTLHRNAERACNEDCGCPKCGGLGFFDHRTDAARDPKRAGVNATCRACAGSGQVFGRRQARIMARIRESCAAYGLRVYEQGDPRGWPLYIIPDESGPKSEDHSRYNQRGVAVCPR